MALSALGLNPSAREERLCQAWCLIEEMQVAVGRFRRERDPLPGMADGTTERLNRMMGEDDIARRMGGIGLCNPFKPRAVDPHMAGLAALHTHQWLAKIRDIQPREDH